MGKGAEKPFALLMDIGQPLWKRSLALSDYIQAPTRGA